jgi:hypothetical protein
MVHAVRSKAATKPADRAAPTRVETPPRGTGEPAPGGAASGRNVDREFFAWFAMVVTLSLACWGLLFVAAKALLGL